MGGPVRPTAACNAVPPNCRGHIDNRGQADVRCALRSDTPPRVSQFRQSAPVTSTAGCRTSARLGLRLARGGRGSGSAQSRATGISGLISGPCAAAPGERSGRRSSVGDLLAKPPSCHMGNASTVVPRDHELGRAPLTRGVGLVHSSRISVQSTFGGAERITPTLAIGILRFGYQP
jgi:hypothetical protein